MAYGLSGRKRNISVEREPNGRAVRKPVDSELIAKLQPHRMCLPESLRLDPKAENHMGRLNLIGTLTDDQYESGRRFAQVVSNYRAVIFSPKANPSSIAGIPIKGMFDIDDDECTARKVAYDWAYAALGRAELSSGKTSPGIANLAQRAVAAVAVHDQPCPTAVEYLRAGLDALSKHFGIKTSSVRFQARVVPIFESTALVY